MDTKTQIAVESYWDYIIIGTGMGGSVLGLSLAKAGKRVLFCEKGLALEKLNATGEYPEMVKTNNKAELYKKAGRRFASLLDMSYKKPREFTPFIGEGAGGSSLLYGMAMERGHAEDFNAWPISYQEMLPYYNEAESLFGVAPSKSLHPQNQDLNEYFTSKGLNPYRLPLASQQTTECQGCQGQLCDHHNKNHAGNRALKKALKIEGTLLLDDCEVQYLNINENKISNVVIKRNNHIYQLNADNIVLAAGALETPKILFKSQNDTFTNGLANSSGQVGKNLMRHLIDLYVLKVNASEEKGIVKQLAFNDFYQIPEGKGGTVQSFGYMPPTKVIIQDVLRDISFHSKFASKIVKLFTPFLSFFLKKKFSNSLVFASIVEDSPCESNQIINSKDQTSFIYKVHPSDKVRLNSVRNKLNAVFKDKLKMKIYSGEKNTLLAHACGTCRMGNDPKNSVVDKNGRSHDIENLFIADASVFPTSLGVNPALTIAANALRMANAMTNVVPTEKAYTTQKTFELV